MKTNLVDTLVRNVVRLAVLWLVDALSLGAASWVLPGMTFSAVGDASRWTVLIGAALLLAIINFVIRPIILLLARPLGWVALLVVGFLVNALALWITAWLLPGFDAGLVDVLLGGIVIAFFNAILTGILEIDEEGSWYQGRVERLARERPFAAADEPGVGLMMVEIDGLSYWHLRHALDRGLMPTLQAMIDEDGYELSLTDCGLPSMTSACQAGIMFGDNYDIPAYRWYDKSQKRTYVSASDATELNGRYAHGDGLMRGGSSILNMMNGDAAKSMFTMANMFEASEEEKKQRAGDVTLLMLNPYFLTRALALFIVELGRELWEAWQQKRKNVQPRLNRMEHWYPLVRAAMCSLMRDIAAHLAILDMMRGAPSIYMLYLGYDEVAHHSGPWTNDAFGDLKRLDKTLARLRHVIKERAPRAYDLIILSDHGQSFGPTFLQRYGVTIKEFIEQQLPEGTTVAQRIGGDTGAYALHGVAGELANVQSSSGGSALDRTLAQQGQKLAARGAVEADEGHAQRYGAGSGSGNGSGNGSASGPAKTAAKASENASDQEAQVIAYGSGNAAQVYFDLFPRKITLTELETAYPGMIEAVVQHAGIGLVLGLADDGSIMALGKQGRHNLTTGVVEGEDPILPYAPITGHGASTVETRVWQLRRVMEFPNAGDLWLISTVYPDGTVAALEELVGNHGGVGGEQTDAFVFHPPQMVVTPTRNSTDVFHLLNQHRGAPVVKPPQVETPVIRDWAPANLLAGIGRVGAWMSAAARCLFLERKAYQEVAADPYMTGPALLIMVVMITAGSLLRADGFHVWDLLGALALWLLSLVVVSTAGYLLTRSVSFTRVVRALGFSHVVNLVVLLGLVPALRPLAGLLSLVLGFLATWMAMAQATGARGWRALLLPVAVYVVLISGAVLVQMLVTGAGFSLNSVMDALGLSS